MSRGNKSTVSSTYWNNMSILIKADSDSFLLIFHRSHTPILVCWNRNWNELIFDSLKMLKKLMLKIHQNYMSIGHKIIGKYTYFFLLLLQDLSTEEWR